MYQPLQVTFMLSQTVLQALIILFGIAGLTVSSYLHFKKKNLSDGMACPMDGSCEDVITSKYSKFLGLDVEILGILYYTTIIVAYTVFLFTPQVAPSWFVFGVLMSSIVAVMFSLYLTFLQAFTLKMWCTWCLISAAFTALILVAALPAAAIGLTSLMAQFIPVLIWLAVIGAAIGLGTSIAFDALYLTFLKDFEISDTQEKSLNTINHLVWASVAAVFLGTAGLALGDPGMLENPAFLASAFVLGFIILNDSIYTLYLGNKMSSITFAEKDEGKDYSTVKQASFMLASFSTVSWTFLLTLQVLSPQMNVYNLLAVFMALLGIIGLGGLFMSAVMERRAKGEMPDWSPLH